ELAVVATGTTADLAPVAVARRELGRAVEFREMRSSSQGFPYRTVRAEGHAELLEERSPLLVGSRRRDEADVQSLDRVDLVVVDFGENDLLAQAERVVPLPVERLARDALEVAG